MSTQTKVNALLQNYSIYFGNIFNEKVYSFSYSLQLKETHSYIHIVDNPNYQNIYINTKAYKADPFILPYEHVNSGFIFLDLNANNLISEFKDFLAVLQQNLNINSMLSVIEKTSSNVQTFLWGFSENLETVKPAILHTYASTKKLINFCLSKFKKQMQASNTNTNFTKFSNDNIANIYNSNKLLTNNLLSWEQKLDLLSKVSPLNKENLNLLCGFNLSYQEECCLNLYANGYNIREIADILKQQKTMVEQDITNIKSYFKVSTRSEMQHVAKQLRILGRI